MSLLYGHIVMIKPANSRVYPGNFRTKQMETIGIIHIAALIIVCILVKKAVEVPKNIEKDEFD
jgi:hypothetical protein